MMTSSHHVYEVHPCKDRRGFDLISDAYPIAFATAFGSPSEHRSRSHHAVIRVYDTAGNVIETHEHKSDFKEC